MKTIRLTPQQRKDIGERRRNAPDRRIYQRLSAVLWSDDGRTREEIAELLGVSTRQVGQWLRIFRNKGLEELCTLHYQGDPGRLGPAQVKRLRQEIEKGVFHNADQIRTWVEATFGVAYSASGLKDLLRRIGASYHKVSGFFSKADVEEQRRWLRKHRRHKREAGPGIRRYFVDACHPVRGVGLLYSCWLLKGQRFYATASQPARSRRGSHVSSYPTWRTTGRLSPPTWRSTPCLITGPRTPFSPSWNSTSS